MKAPPYPSQIFKSARISPCGKYRYELTRSWDDTKPAVAFVMLNPSTADAVEDDPTIRKCIGFAQVWGFGELRVYNLFAIRATDPRELDRPGDLHGPEFDAYATKPTECHTIVVAWGSKPSNMAKRPSREKWRAIDAIMHRDLHAIAVNADGSPRHPLYIPYSATLKTWSPR